MKTLLILIAVFAFSGCSVTSLSKMYDTTKTIYVDGKEIVITNSHLIPEKTLLKLKELDEKIHAK